LICGGLKIAYDLLLLTQFRHLKPPEEQMNQPAIRKKDRL
jgi:hypothetical protein